MIRVGLAGYGLGGSVFHAPLIGACEEMELTGIWTSRDVPLRVESLDAVIGRADLIVIATPNATHFELAKAALEAGRHVVIDKPFTASVREADELIALAEARGRKLTVFHNRRWDSDFLTVRSMLPTLGTVHLFEAHWDRFRLAIRDSWKEQAQDGNGLLPDLGSHMIDQMLQLFGQPDALQADLAAQRDGAMIEDYFQIAFRYGSMRAVIGASTLVSAPRPRFSIHGTEGSFIKYGVDPQEEQLKQGVTPLSDEMGRDRIAAVLIRPDGSREEIAPKQGTYRAFYEQVAGAILHDAPLPVLASEAREVMRIIEAARDSARSGNRLRLAAC